MPVLPTPKGKYRRFQLSKDKPPHTLWPLFQYITACQIQLVSFCGPVMHADHNYMTECDKLAASKVQKVIDLRVKSLGWQHCPMRLLQRVSDH